MGGVWNFVDFRLIEWCEGQEYHPEAEGPERMD